MKRKKSWLATAAPARARRMTSRQVGGGSQVRRADAKTVIASQAVRSNSPLMFVPEWSEGERESGNALIHGDNHQVLSYLAERRPQTIRCIYFDPPYNNGESYRHYFDSMGHDEWLDAVTARLEQALKLLTPDGSIWISIDDSEVHYLKVAADKIFGRENFLGTIIWERRTTRENRVSFSRNHEYLLVYARNAPAWKASRNKLPASGDILARYRNIDNDVRGAWQSISANAQDGHATPQQFYAITSPSGMVHIPPKGRCWVYPKYRMETEIKNNNIWFGANGDCVPRIKKFLSGAKSGVAPETLWHANEVGTTALAKKQLLALFSENSLFDTPKPEELIQRILTISTSSSDTVLDADLPPFGGPGLKLVHRLSRDDGGAD